MLIWYGAGAVAAIVIAWLAALVHASGHAPIVLVSLAVGVVILALYFHRLEKYVGFDPALWRPQLSVLSRLLRIGLPAGAETNALSHGISGMRQRVRALKGDFRIRGRPGAGTVIEVQIPLDAAPEGTKKAGTATAPA